MAPKPIVSPTGTVRTCYVAVSLLVDRGQFNGEDDRLALGLFCVEPRQGHTCDHLPLRRGQSLIHPQPPDPFLNFDLRKSSPWTKSLRLAPSSYMSF